MSPDWPAMPSTGPLLVGSGCSSGRQVTRLPESGRAGLGPSGERLLLPEAGWTKPLILECRWRESIDDILIYLAKVRSIDS